MTGKFVKMTTGKKKKRKKKIGGWSSYTKEERGHTYEGIDGVAEGTKVGSRGLEVCCKRFERGESS